MTCASAFLFTEYFNILAKCPTRQPFYLLALNSKISSAGPILSFTQKALSAQIRLKFQSAINYTIKFRKIQIDEVAAAGVAAAQRPDRLRMSPQVQDQAAESQVIILHHLRQNQEHRRLVCAHHRRPLPGANTGPALREKNVEKEPSGVLHQTN